MYLIMHKVLRPNDAVHHYMSEQTARVVAKTGNPSDRFHMGKLILQGFRDAPDFLMQIDGSTGESETHRSMEERSVKCAIAFERYGLKSGDVMVVMGPNHNDMAVPVYAALYLGIAVAPVDKNLSVHELKDTFSMYQPRLIICHGDKTSDIEEALRKGDLKSDIMTFEKSIPHQYLFDFIQKHAFEDEVENFECSDFDPSDTIAFILPTSGTTGVPKGSASTHRNYAVMMPYVWAKFRQFPCPSRLAMVVSPLHWLSAVYHCLMSPILRYTRLQSSKPVADKHAAYLFSKYKPTFLVISPTMLNSIMNFNDDLDLTSLESLMIGGSSVPEALVKELKRISPNTEVVQLYGLTEATCITLNMVPEPIGTCGYPMGMYQYRLINVDTQEDVVEPNIAGELWIKGPGIFKGYYNRPDATAQAMADDGWFITGDMFYRDVHWNFFFVERIKLLLKYNNHHISPLEVESVIQKHPGVLDVVVTGVPDPQCGELPVACVVRRQGYTVTEREIQDLVKDTLSETKQLRGGVIFLDKIPLTSSTKIHRRRVKEIAVEKLRVNSS